jgi:hypothetical protein
MSVRKEQRRLVAEYVSREMMEALDVGVLLDIEANLMRSLQHTSPEAPDGAHARTVKKILTRAWHRVGQDVLGRMVDAELAAGRESDETGQLFSGSGMLGT